MPKTVAMTRAVTPMPLAAFQNSDHHFLFGCLEEGGFSAAIWWLGLRDGLALESLTRLVVD